MLAPLPTHNSWPAEGQCRIPYWVYFDRANYEHEQERIFRGAVWNYVGLEAEIPKPGDFKTSFVGETPVIVTRDVDNHRRCSTYWRAITRQGASARS